MTKFPKKVLAGVLVLLQVACLRSPASIDAAPRPADVNDLTVMMSGCLSKPTAGYLFCKISEGSDLTQTKIRLYAPKETCERESCFKYQFLKRDGSLGFAGAIKRGDGFSDIALSDIADLAGEYQVMIRLWWVDPNEKIEKTSRADGLIRLWFTTKEAQPFACNDPQLGWQLPISKTCRADVSSNLRVAMCGQDCER